MLPMARQHHRTPSPICPHCEHKFNSDEMTMDYHEICLFGLAHAEDRAAIKCPVCDQEFWIQGGWNPEYTSVLAEEDLDY